MPQAWAGAWVRRNNGDGARDFCAEADETSALRVVEALALEDVGGVFFDAGGAGGGLFGVGEVEEVGALAAGGEGVEGGFEFGGLVEGGLEFLGDGEVGGFFEWDFFAGGFDGDGLVDVGFEGFGEGFDFLGAGEADLAGGLDVFGLLDEDFFWVLQEGAFEEE